MTKEVVIGVRMHNGRRKLLKIFCAHKNWFRVLVRAIYNSFHSGLEQFQWTLSEESLQLNHGWVLIIKCHWDSPTIYQFKKSKERILD